MHPIDPTAHLRLMAQDREKHLAHQRHVRIADARAELARHERRVDEAWRELVAALDDVSGARHTLVAIDRS